MLHYSEVSGESFLPASLRHPDEEQSQQRGTVVAGCQSDRPRHSWAGHPLCLVTLRPYLTTPSHSDLCSSTIYDFMWFAVTWWASWRRWLCLYCTSCCSTSAHRSLLLRTGASSDAVGLLYLRPFSVVQMVERNEYRNHGAQAVGMLTAQMENKDYAVFVRWLAKLSMSAKVTLLLPVVVSYQDK